MTINNSKDKEQNRIEKAREIIKNSKKIVVFTGAGISTESGIPDFRSPGGLWTRFNPEIYANYDIFLQDPSKYWEMERVISKMIQSAKPNPAHKSIVTLEKTGTLLAIITQNIDFLHQRAGSSVPIYELHGTTLHGTCKQCHTIYSHDELLKKMETEEIPHCSNCSALIKPDVILFNEEMPVDAITGASTVVEICDCFIVIGSSLSVLPANLFPSRAKHFGAKLIIVNLEPTFLDLEADVCIHGKAGELLPKLINNNERS